MEFTLARKTAKVSAESIRKLQPGTVAPEVVEPAILDGKIIRCMRIVNPEQEEYPGLVQVCQDDDDSVSRRKESMCFESVSFLVINSDL